MVGNVYEVVLAKAHEWIELAKLKCRMPCFLQKNSVSVNEGVLGMVWLCFRLVREYEVCSQSWFELLLAGSECWTSFAKLLL